MRGASRFIMLLATPFPFLLHSRPSSILRRSLLSLSTNPHHHHHHHHHHLLTLPPSSLSHPLLLPIKSSHQLHTLTNSLKDDHSQDPPSPAFSSRPSHPWPEWSMLLDTISANGYFDRHRFGAPEGLEIIPEDDAFVAYEELSDDFFCTACACLAFARERYNILGWLSRRDIQVVVENGTPFLFKSALDTARRMRSFLCIAGSNVLEADKAHTVDLLKYLLSYASNPSASPERDNLYSRELVESSVRNLLREMAEVICRVSVSDVPAPEQYQFSGGYGQTPRPLGRNIEMKRGDWICPKCSFMNFARNVKCLECEELRPKRQLTGGEWECPQCDFFNYGRNLVCLRCDCKRPGDASCGDLYSRSGLEYRNGDHSDKASVDSRLAENEEKAQRWFSKISQMDKASDMSSAAGDEDLNRFVVSTRKTPLERRLANSQIKRNLGNNGTSEVSNSQPGGANKNLDKSMNLNLDQILGRTSVISGTDNKSITSGQDAGTASCAPLSRSGTLQYGQPRESNSSYVPFVALPPDMFANKPQNSNMDDSEKALTESSESTSSFVNEQATPVSLNGEPGKLGVNSQLFGRTVVEAEMQVKDQDGNSERLLKKVAELHDVTDLPSAISDEDLPEFMPIRKGENRFVVTKKKDRSLTSPMYKRQMAMEQANNTSFVPFVPFPPDYFAKMDKQQPDGTGSTIKPAGETSSLSTNPVKFPEKLSENRPEAAHKNQMPRLENQHSSPGNWNSKSHGDYGVPVGHSTQSSFSSQSVNKDSWSSGYPGKENTCKTTNLSRNSPELPENQNGRSGWVGKSLEGSAVKKEPDPLDMSEEAKAERWFRRVAQIKDISELSQIPDEDFPSIMPMRKGVNRFVVSKRKTPLERRLTSPQYRRNLPIVISDPVKKENDES